VVVLSERTLHILWLVAVVLNVVVAVVSFRRGDTSAMVIAIALAVLFLIQVIRPTFGSRSTEHDDRTPPELMSAVGLAA